ncbi:MAG: hypothetical protein R3A80_09040 [Bdellovibrionota bacterium]
MFQRDTNYFENIRDSLDAYGVPESKVPVSLDANNLTSLIFNSIKQNDTDLLKTILNIMTYDFGIALNWDSKNSVLSVKIETERELEGIYKELDFSFPGGSPRDLNEFIARNTYDKLLHDLKKTKGFEAKKHALLSAILECPNTVETLGEKIYTELGGEKRFQIIKADTQSQLDFQYFRRDQANKKLSEIGFPVESHSNEADKSDLNRLTWFRFLFDSSEFKLGKYSPVKLGRRKGISYGFSHIGAGAGGLIEFVCLLAPEIAQSNDNASFLVDENLYARGRTELDNKSKEETCKRLAQLSRL